MHSIRQSQKRFWQSLLYNILQSKSKNTDFYQTEQKIMHLPPNIINNSLIKTLVQLFLELLLMQQSNFLEEINLSDIKVHIPNQNIYVKDSVAAPRVYLFNIIHLKNQIPQKSSEAIVLLLRHEQFCTTCYCYPPGNISNASTLALPNSPQLTI